MDNQTGLTCSSINLRGTPDLKSSVIEALNPQEHVEVLEDAGTMVKVQATRWNPPVLGYVLKSSIINRPPDTQFFPKIDVGNGIQVPSVPASVPLATFLTWLTSQSESPWLPANYVNTIKAGQQPSVGSLIRQAIADHQADWDAWVAEVNQQGRQAMAIMDEWLVIMAGGRPMWSFRTERIFAQPSQSAAAPAWVTPTDVLLWTGHVRFNNQEPKYKVWYDVKFTKLDKEFRGWYKASILEEFIFPTPDTDLTVPENKNKVFDLSRPLLRLPADPEIDAARKAGMTGAQYINIKGATGWSKVNHNLCGEFCAAALGGSDVIPFLKQWIISYKGAKHILEVDYGTAIPDLESMLDVVQKKYEYFQAEASIIPLTPAYLRKVLDSGRMALIGTGITYDGKLKWGSRIRHWVVIEDLIRVANNGWVRVYNPFSDKEEVYPYNVVFDAATGTVLGLLVTPTPP
jgi:hypothetical protein